MQISDHQLIDYYEQAERFFWSNISVEIAQFEGTEVYCSGVNNLFLNSAIQRKPLTEANLQNTLDNIQVFYQKHNMPWVWIIREDLLSFSIESVPPLQTLDKSIIMYRPLNNPLPTAQLNDLSFIEDNQDLTAWGICLNKAYQSATEETAIYSDAIKQYVIAHQQGTGDKTKFHHFVAYLNNSPVSCATLSLQNGISRIDDVGTIPEHQNKGYATKTILHILSQAKKQRAHTCFLESSLAGITVYEKLGFKPLHSNFYYTSSK